MDLCAPRPHCLSGTSPPTILVPQISTQRKVNIYNILQEIIQQEASWRSAASRGWWPSPPRR